MSGWRGVWLSVGLLAAVVVSGSELKHRIDLERLLTDSTALQRLKILYEPSSHLRIFVYGTGKVITQARPERTLSYMGLVPTCSGSVSEKEIRSLIEDLKARKFFDLPEKGYIYITASDEFDDWFEALKLHGIILDDGQFRARRSFAAGIYMEQQQKLPEDFIAVEAKLDRIAREAIGNEPCRMAAAIKF